MREQTREQPEDKPQKEKKVVHTPNNPDPFEINFLPQFEENRGPREIFVNQYGVTIGDHMYESQESPHQQWSVDTDPSVMSGDEWVHPFKDIGFQTEENREYFEKGIAPQAGIFMHPDKDAAYEMNLENVDGKPSDKPPDKQWVEGEDER